MNILKITIMQAVLFVAITTKAQPSYMSIDDLEINPSKPTCTYSCDTTISYTSQDTIKLAATLTMPNNGKRRVPAVVLMSGTGEQDRDCTMAGHKLFAELADYLSSRGIAVLRTDDRGVGGSTGNYSLATTADFADDALAAVDYLKTVKGVDRKRIGLIGHSEGGASISIAASKSKDVAFIISLAGLMTDGLNSVIQQNKDIVKNSPIPYENKRRLDEINYIMFHTAYKYAHSDTLDSVLWHRYDEWKTKDNADWERNHPGETDNFRYSIYMYTLSATSPWYRFFIRYNPSHYLSHVNVPVLAINGEKDIMVNCEQNLSNVRCYLAHNPDVTTRSFPNLNHLLLPCQRGSQDEYSKITAPTSPAVLETVWQWIKQRYL